MYFGLILSCILASSSHGADTPNTTDTRSSSSISNLSEYVQDFRAHGAYAARTGIKRIKVAILDNSFSGYETARGVSLPSDVEYHPGPPASAVADISDDPHGLVMAQLLYGLMTEQ